MNEISKDILQEYISEYKTVPHKMDNIDNIRNYFERHKDRLNFMGIIPQDISNENIDRMLRSLFKEQRITFNNPNKSLNNKLKPSDFLA